MSKSLDQVTESQAVITAINVPADAAKRLKSLGVFEGQRIGIARRGDPLIVKAAGSRIAIALLLAKGILVESPA